MVWTFSGVRSLYDDGAESASAATRDYELRLEKRSGAPVLHIFGGKITTYRKLAESALQQVEQALDHRAGPWTSGVPLPGGDFSVDAFVDLCQALEKEFPFLDATWANRMVRAYGTDARRILSGATSRADLGTDFGASLCEREVRWLMEHEFAQTPEDVVWRRSKLGLRLDDREITALDRWMQQQTV